MKYTKETQEIASQLWDIIQREVDDQSDRQFEEKLENLKYALEDLIRDAKETRDDFKDQGLTYGTLEAEGYLRAMLTVESILENY
jgi:rubrerythrin